MNKINVRKIKRKLNDNKSKVLIVLIISLFFISATGYAILTTTISIGGKATIATPQDPVINKCKDSIYGYITQNSSWPGVNKTIHHTILTIKNIGDKDIMGWTIQVYGPSDLGIEFTNAKYAIGDGYVVLSNMYWNGKLSPGETLTLEVAFNTVEKDLNISKILVNDCNIYEIATQDPSGDSSLVLKSIILSPYETDMVLGSELDISASKVPSTAFGEIEWLSSDESVVSVSQTGHVKALKIGEATITARSGGISSTSKINVVYGSPTSGNEIINLSFEPIYSNDGSHEIQFRIILKNLSNVSHTKLNFKLNMPEGSSYTLWNNPGFTVSNNIFDMEMQYGNMLDPYGILEITGIIILPSNYSVNNYLNPIISDIIILD